MASLEDVEGNPSSFWAVEILPGEHSITTVPEFDLHITQAVLPADAKDTGRTVVNVKVGEKTFAVASLKLNTSDSQSVDLIFDADRPVSFSVTGKNPVHLVGYYVGGGGEESEGEDDEDMYGQLGLGEDSDEELGEIDEDDDEDDDEVDQAIEQRLLAAQAQKRKANGPAAGEAKKAKVETQAQPQGKGQQGKGQQQQQQQQQPQQKKPQSPAQNQPKAQPKQGTPQQGQKQGQKPTPKKQ